MNRVPAGPPGRCACDADEQAIGVRVARPLHAWRVVWRADRSQWVDSFMHAAFTSDLSSFPPLPDHVADARQDYLPA